MNIREERKKRRLDSISHLLLNGFTREELANVLIANFAVSKRTALEEIDAIKFMEGLNDETKNKPSYAEENKLFEAKPASRDLLTESENLGNFCVEGKDSSSTD